MTGRARQRELTRSVIEPHRDEPTGAAPLIEPKTGARHLLRGLQRPLRERCQLHWIAKEGRHAERLEAIAAAPREAEIKRCRAVELDPAEADRRDGRAPCRKLVPIRVVAT